MIIMQVRAKPPTTELKTYSEGELLLRFSALASAVFKETTITITDLGRV